jgi:hypothetical protein
MRRDIQKPETSQALKGLKDFQRKTVDYVFHRLYEDGRNRFLIADEVGLGKTLVARGVVARSIDHLWGDIKNLERIDVIYICSNSDIAGQNIDRLNVFRYAEAGAPPSSAFATRLTLLPIYLNDLENRRFNFVAFTPGTSFNLHSSGGVARERALLYHMLRDEWGFGNDAAPKNIFQYGVQDRPYWHAYLRNFASELRSGSKKIEESLHRSFLASLKAIPELKKKYMDLAGRFGHFRMQRNIPEEDRADQRELIGDLRRVLASSCVKKLKPAVVILDEFQRFKDLLDGTGEDAQLAQILFKTSEAKTILLSATPYKPYTMYSEAGVDDHYQDFIRTVGFLVDQSDNEIGALKSDLQKYREALFRPGEENWERVVEAKNRVEDRLRRVMVRTERLSINLDRNGMVEEVTTRARQIEPSDLRGFTLIDKVAQKLNVGDTVEYWKSAPYLLNTMDRRGYKIKKEFLRAVVDQEFDTEFMKVFAKNGKGLLAWKDIEAYREIDPGNARIRALFQETVTPGAWKLLWVPPCSPYYSVSDGPYAEAVLQNFSKVLVFSSWQIVPKVIALLCSYEAERNMMLENTNSDGEPGELYSRDYSRKSRLLDFTVKENHPDRMSILSLFYPCLTLAQKVDPLMVSADLAKGGEIPACDKVKEVLSRKIKELLNPAIVRYSKRGKKDSAWYWAALALLDRTYHEKTIHAWLSSDEDGICWKGMAEAKGRDESRFAEYVGMFCKMFYEPSDLGEPPDDLFEVLSKVALASPAVVTLRSIMRMINKEENAESGANLMGSVAKAALGFRTLFNIPSTISMLRRYARSEESRYWETVLDYCVQGNLQSVLDEYVHILRESLGLLDKEPEKIIQEMGGAIADAVSIRTINLAVDEIRTSSGIELTERTMRCRFALRFGDGQGDVERGEDSSETRKEQVREAFNSPFWPFVLASTSVGQEGLDFHQYCRKVFHWNLPSNPVDLEQREGRIHRYKGHAIRMNIAERYNLGQLKISPLCDPWELLFQTAHEEAHSTGDYDDLVPFWVFPGGEYKIQRHIPAYPLSKDAERLDILKNNLVTYRLVFGQPRQEDLLKYIDDHLEKSITPEIVTKCLINLSPGQESGKL